MVGRVTAVVERGGGYGVGARFPQRTCHGFDGRMSVGLRGRKGSGPTAAATNRGPNGIGTLLLPARVRLLF